MVGADISVASSHLVLELRLLLVCLVLRLVDVSRFECGLSKALPRPLVCRSNYTQELRELISNLETLQGLVIQQMYYSLCPNVLGSYFSVSGYAGPEFLGPGTYI